MDLGKMQAIGPVSNNANPELRQAMAYQVGRPGYEVYSNQGAPQWTAQANQAELFHMSQEP